jgi:para-aminobenzoate synthetase/4-amino-4-deoxychorismate lyase
LTRHFNDGFHAFIDTTDWTVICGSPELFFELSNGEITTRPMKGTSRRGRWSDEDVLLAERLKRSPKERAENVMVVDMVRNDIGRIAEVGSVEVPSMFDLEVHPSLWQMTSTVTGSCRDEVTVADAFAALFPSASVTGAPKVAAMSLIAELEDAPRGVYCGALGLLRPSANSGPSEAKVDARFAVAIRTAVIDKRGSVVEYGAGGGITEGSDPAREWAEVVMKANAVVAAEPPAAIHGLIETMGFRPHAGGGAIRNLDLHLARLRGSATYFGIPEPSDLEQNLAAALKGAADPLRVRLEVTCQGMCTATTAPLETSPSEAVQRMCIDLAPVDSSDTLLFHKTMDRRTYDVRAARHPSAHDVVLINERGEITETTRANLAVLLEGSWWTPPLSSGLLPGIERARLLASGSLMERVLSVEDLRVAEAVATMSSLRGWRSAVVESDCACDRGKS